MSESLFSTFWYRVADLQPRLRAHVELHRQRFRGQTWHLLQDHQTGRFHRLTPAAHYLVCLMDGRRTMRTIWELAEARYGAEVPAQDSVLRLLAQLHSADLIVAQGLPDLPELDQRAAKIARTDLLTRIRNPLALRLPLLDPDRFLEATMPLVRPFFSWVGALAWIALVGTGVVLAWLHWPALTSNISDRVLSTEKLLTIVLVYPCIKAIHELGHAYATKRWGGEVHEIGIIFLVLIPIPYVDATSSIAFPRWWHRALVAGAGIMVELALAAMAIIGWVNSEPGIARAVMFNTALIGGVSTLLFNGNPLLRYDGHYVLCDLLRIPDLASRSNRYLGYLVQTLVFGVKDADSPVASPSERPWLVVYGILAFAYRVAITIAIALFISSRFFAIGVLLAIWAVITMVIWPLLQGLRFVIAGPQLEEVRRRAILATAGVAALAAGIVFALPIPNATMAEGVVWAPDGSIVRAETPGVVAALVRAPGDEVARGEPLLQLADPELTAMETELRARIKELDSRREAIFLTRHAEAKILSEEIARAAEHLAHLQERIAALTVRAPADGRFILPDADDLIGRFVVRGEELGYTITPTGLRVRTVVPEARVALVRAGSQAVELRLASQIARVVAGRVVRDVPAAGNILPSAVLARPAGGPFPVRPTPDGLPEALTPIFQFDVAADLTGPVRVGERVYVRFDHGRAPLAVLLYRDIRQLFLSRFNA